MTGVATTSSSVASGTPTKLWVAGAFAISTIFTAAVTLTGNYILTVKQQERSEKVSAVQEFAVTAHKFDGLYRVFMNKYLAGGNDAAERAAVQANLMEQNQVLEILKLNLPAEDIELADRYGNQLALVDKELRNPVPVEEAKSLMQAVVDLRDMEIDLNIALRRAAGLPVNVAVTP